MNKKFLGIKLSTILHFVLCVVFAVVAWFLIQYSVYETVEVEECKQAADDAANYFINMLWC